MAATTRGVSVRISVGETSQAGVRHGDGPEPKNNKQKEQTKKHEITNRDTVFHGGSGTTAASRSDDREESV